MSGPVAGACAAAAGQLLRRIRRGLLVVPLGLGGRWRRFRPDPVLRTGRRLGGLYDAPVRAGTSVTKARILVAIGLEGWVRLPKTASRSRAQFLIGRPSRGGPALAAPARPGPARGASTSHGLRSRPIPLTPLWGGAQGESWKLGAWCAISRFAECGMLVASASDAQRNGQGICGDLSVSSTNSWIGFHESVRSENWFPSSFFSRSLQP